MGTAWYVNVEGKEYGPVSSAELKQWADEQRITPQTAVKKGEQGQWVAADRVKGLFSKPSIQQPTEPVSPPQVQPVVREAQPVVREVVHHHHAAPKSAGVAAILEVVPGLLIQTFGIGHMYVGNVGLGLAFMLGYWFVAFINLLLCFVLIGFITWPLCWLVMMVLSPILAANAASKS